ncbi:TolC family outer membrane protein [Halarcobacter sp.]|uniref:TolC family outer membrane protein n=1 Tax=Halarcobacter sp. TaxID=2321133 RepID=UPI0029F59944|nr:TolC family outer membrane protein [Halarcobacter sp.]
MKKPLLSIAASGLLLIGVNLNALTLEKSIEEALNTNPVVKERLKNLREVQQDLNIAKSEWLPSLDYSASFGRNNAGEYKDYTDDDKYRNTVEDKTYNHYTQSLKLTQNIFNGFSTTNKIDYQKSRILAAAHHYVENANDIAFQMVGSYLDSIRSYRLLQNAKDNVRVNEKIYEDVQSLFNSGLTTKSEMTKIRSSLALAESNLVVQQNNMIDKGFRFKRLLGRKVNISELSLPKLNLSMPESLERATMVAIRNNPSILVSNYNIKGAQSLYKEKKSKYYPKIDLEIEQVYNDVDKRNSFDSPDDRTRGYITLNWNLYKGGAHEADIQKSRSSINKEVEIQRDLKRQTIESLELSWSAYEMLTDQLEKLYKYYEYSEETLASYQSEYEMGRRTLLDLLSAQNDLINSKSQIINAQTDKLFAQFRILDAMGLLVSSVLDEKEYENIIYPTQKPFEIVEDKLPVKLDIDNDGIVDSLDICDNSTSNGNIKPTGCVQQEADSDFDGVPNTKDACPNSTFGVLVDDKGCALPDGKNKFEPEVNTYLNPVPKYSAQSPKKDEKLGLYDYEFNVAANKNVESTQLDKHLMYDDFELIKRFDFIDMNSFDIDNNNIKQIAEKINSYKRDDITVTVIGHTQNMKDDETSYNQALDYSKTITKLLVDNNVSEKIIVPQSRVNYDNLFLETDKHDINNVVAIALYIPKVKEEIILDDDNDGVRNELDKCPNTASGYTVDKDGCTNKINLEVLFENNSSKIKDKTKEKVEAFAKFLIDNKEFNTMITGHASKENENSSIVYNKSLSEQRANAIKSYLISKGVKESRIEAQGKGFDEPIADNSTEEGRALNRRIEAELINVNNK